MGWQCRCWDSLDAIAARCDGKLSSKHFGSLFAVKKKIRWIKERNVTSSEVNRANHPTRVPLSEETSEISH